MFEGIDKLQIDRVYAQERQVFARKCPECGRLHYPAVLRCKGCGYRRYPEEDAEFIWHKRGYKSWPRVPLQGPCTLLSWTRLWNLPEGFDQRYVDFALVEFDNGVRALGHLDVAEPAAGMKLTGQARKLRQIDGEDFYGLLFSRP